MGYNGTMERIKLFKISMFDDRRFALQMNNLDAQAFSYAHVLVSKFPERKFDRHTGVWMVPFSRSNMEYLARTFHPDEYDLSDEAKVVVEYQVKTDRALAQRERRRWEYVFEDKVPELKLSYHTPPFNHQVVALDAVHGSEYFGILMETGTGKTKVAIDEMRWSADEKVGKGAFKVLVVCPRGVIGTWLHELKKHLPPDYPVWVCRAWSGAYMVEQLLYGIHSSAKLKVWVTNYDRMKRDKEVYSKVGFDLMVLDESTRVKNPFAKRTKAVCEVGQTVHRRIIMTGTPVGNNVLDLFSQFQFLSPGCLGYDTYMGYKMRYGKLEKGMFTEKVVGWQHLDELKERMARCSFIVRKKDCLDLPEKVYETRDVTMGKVQRDLYIQMVDTFVASLDAEMKNTNTVQATIILTQFLRLSQICCGFLKTMDGKITPIPDGQVKLQAVHDVIDEMDPDQKLIIWARFRYDIPQLYASLTRAGHTCSIINGDTPENERQPIIDAFNTDEGQRIFIGEPTCAGEGITLLGTDRHPCSTVIYYSNDFSHLKRQQSEDRCYRYGTKVSVTYIDICCEQSIDEYICDKLQKKKNLNECLKDYETIKAILLGVRGSIEQS